MAGYCNPVMVNQFIHNLQDTFTPQKYINAFRKQFSTKYFIDFIHDINTFN